MNKQLDKLLRSTPLWSFSLLTNEKVTKEVVLRSKSYLTKIQENREYLIRTANNMLKLKNLRKEQLIQWSNFLKIFELADKEGIDNIDLHILWANITKRREERKNLYSLKPKKEGRDNKDVLVVGHSCNSNRNKVRYPSKKRSKKHWANFYKLFPMLAEQDGWNGITSNKMK